MVWKLITDHPVPFLIEDVALDIDDPPCTLVQLHDGEGIRKCVPGVRILAREAMATEAIASMREIAGGETDPPPV